MPSFARLGDMTTGHSCFPSIPIISGSENCFINGLPAATLTSALPVHTCNKSSHSSIIISGSENVFINGLPAASIGSMTSCGDMIGQGSENCFCN